MYMWGNPDISRKEPEGTVEKQTLPDRKFCQEFVAGEYLIEGYHKQQLRDLEIPAPFATPH